MLENLLAPILLSQNFYVYLTPVNKVAVERKITEKRALNAYQIAPVEISNILGFQPQCGKPVVQGNSRTQIHCTWTEGSREIKAYWSEPWNFQRWESTGF
ncbi:hypothetical protein V0288_05765 [Pannus brasiliensis CCIBt3594]|uniref:Uncharacterized protein n=1 Tax=Pannus brasiliensis CCIBt3594 TaxID=1427578 RepID=A0AAW9QSI0_9CHRO